MSDEVNLTELKKDLLTGQRRALAKAITLAESSKEEHQLLARELLESVLPKTGKSFRLGISGPPGVGKSTFIEAFGQLLIEQQKAKVAVLAVDPSSPLSGGSLLADKTRMETLSQMDEAFIRPSPTSGALGGVALKTREALLLCEAAGYDYILIETVGVGQSEYEVRNMVDFFITLIQPGSGDELQGIKKGILEMSQLVAVNKCDGDNLTAGEVSAGHYKNALSLSAQEGQWQTPVLQCSSTKKTGLNEILKTVQSFREKENYLALREEQNLVWFNQLAKEQFSAFVKNKMTKQWDHLAQQVRNQELSPIKAADSLIAQLKN